MKINDAMDFFRYRQGNWASWRVTHHLAFRRSESGESAISMKVLDADDERIISLCKDWDVDPSSAQGGCYVTWNATLDWDQEGENHEGETIFALVPEKDDIRRGKILRDRGYAEIVPIAGTFHLDEYDNLNLETPYDGGAVIEHFKFDGRDNVNRLSTVKRFGGFSTVTFASEQRIVLPKGQAVHEMYNENTSTDLTKEEEEEAKRVFDMMTSMSMETSGEAPPISYDDFVAQFHGIPSTGEDDDDDDEEELTEEEIFECLDESFLNVLLKANNDVEEEPKDNAPVIRKSRWGTTYGSASEIPANSAFSSGFGSAPTGRSSPTSAFPSGFSSQPATSPEMSNNENGNGHEEANDMKTIEELATKAGVDLSKVPPSMREDFLATFESERKAKET